MTVETTRKEYMIKIAIILGSTRPGRNGEAVAKWVYEIAHKRTDAEFELVDIKDFNLLLDEPIPPSTGQYSKPSHESMGCRDRFFRWLAELKHNVVALAKAAKVLGVPIFVTAHAAYLSKLRLLGAWYGAEFLNTAG